MSRLGCCENCYWMLQVNLTFYLEQTFLNCCHRLNSLLETDLSKHFSTTTLLESFFLSLFYSLSLSLVWRPRCFGIDCSLIPSNNGEEAKTMPALSNVRHMIFVKTWIHLFAARPPRAPIHPWGGCVQSIHVLPTAWCLCVWKTLHTLTTCFTLRVLMHTFGGPLNWFFLSVN